MTAVDRFGYGCLDEATVRTIRGSLNDEVIPRHLRFLEDILLNSKTGWIANTEGTVLLFPCKQELLDAFKVKYL